MKFPKGSSQAALAVREKARNYRRHWTPFRSQVAHAVAFASPVSTKGSKRIAKRRRMDEMYLAFFTNPENMAKVRELKFEWGVSMIRRLVRDEVLGRFG